ncbi:MAG TPA: Na/Pi cotransporter family protein [Spirochaetota bacterium]|nr:Na/Pi cotransporter family protein [Spirochaetota bacterium]HOL56800.1 Na/Pi cotransporter family protein [Spirochaetota bacterium]HPP03869.1 Na/Pi cotransporter family protein [Spirochaetota bacterium]
MLLGGLGIFIYGMKLMSESLEKASGDNLKILLSKMTSNRFLGVLTGFLITAIIQSSSATTVMVVSFVNAGLINLIQAISIIMGANIGTTVTAWIVNITNFKIDIVQLSFIAAFLGVGFMFLPNNNIKTWGGFLVGFAILFIGLNFLKEAIPRKELTSSNTVYHFFQMFEGKGYISIIIYVLIGTVFTMILQSSSATMAFTITLINAGYLSLESGVAMVLGENIGTTITAFLASIPANHTAKKAALSHTLFNVIGVCWVLLPFVFPNMLKLINLLTGNLPFIFKGSECGVKLAFFHSLFNISNTTLFIGFVPFYAKFIDLIMGKARKEEKFKLRLFSMSLIQTPDLALLEAQNKIKNMSLIVKDMFNKTCDFFEEEKEKKNKDISITSKSVKEMEKEIDQYRTEISQFLFTLLKQNASEKTAENINYLLEETRNWEWISDCCKNIAKLVKKSTEDDLGIFYTKKEENFRDIIDTLSNFFDLIIKEYNPTTDLKKLKEKGEELEERINVLYKKMRKKTISDMSKKKIKNITSALLFMEVIQEFEHIGDALKYILRGHRYFF